MRVPPVPITRLPHRDTDVALKAMEYLKELIYPLEEPFRVRTKPMQVLAVGTSRSGTDSLRAALLELGYNHTYHGFDIAMNPGDQKVWYKLWRKKWQGADHASHPGDVRITAADFDQVLGESVAITDIDAAAFASELIAAYPNAKVILNMRRDADAWYASNMATMIPVQRDLRLWLRSWFCPEHFWLRANFFCGIWPSFYRGDFEHTAKWVLREHCAMVKGLVPRERLLEWGPEDGWGSLCEFLGKKMPDTEFPNGNVKDDFSTRLEGYYRAANAKADKNMATLAGFLALTGVVLVYILS